MGALLGLLPDLLGIGAATAGGGLFGMVGMFVSSYFKAKQVKADREFEEKKWDREERLLKLQREVASAEHDERIETAHEEGRWEGLADSIKADAAIGASYRWVNAFKSLFRPFITTVLVALSVLIFFKLLNVVRGGDTNGLALFLTQEDATAMLRYIVYGLTFAAQTSVVWFFGERASAPPGTKNS